MTQQPRGRRWCRGWCIALALVFASLTAPAPVRAEEPGMVASGLGGLSAGLLTLVYTPLKIAYAACGLAVSPLVYLYSVGDLDATARIARNSVKGDWVVTPDHLGSEQTLHFFGEG